jgi:hypothetical protein
MEKFKKALMEEAKKQAKTNEGKIDFWLLVLFFTLFLFFITFIASPVVGAILNA